MCRSILLTLLLSACWRSDLPPQPPAHVENIVRVSTTDELLEALRPNVTIELAPGDYAIDKIDRSRGGPHHRWSTVFEGNEDTETDERNMLILEKLHDVVIRAEKPGVPTRL